MWMMVITAATVLFAKMFLTMRENTDKMVRLPVHSSLHLCPSDRRVYLDWEWAESDVIVLSSQRNGADGKQLSTSKNSEVCVFVSVCATESKRAPERNNMHTELSKDKVKRWRVRQKMWWRYFLFCHLHPQHTKSTQHSKETHLPQVAE